MTVYELKKRILQAIKAGNHHTTEIITACNAELYYKNFCLAIAELQIEGHVICEHSGYQLAD